MLGTTIAAYVAGVATPPLVLAGGAAAYCLVQKVRGRAREREARRRAREVYERLDAGCGIASLRALAAEERRDASGCGAYHPRLSEVLPGEAWWCDSSIVQSRGGGTTPGYVLCVCETFRFDGELTCCPDGPDQILVGRMRGGGFFADIDGERIRAGYVRSSEDQDLVELRSDGDVIWVRETLAPNWSPPPPPAPEGIGVIRRLTEEEMLARQVDAVFAEAEARDSEEKGERS